MRNLSELQDLDTSPDLYETPDDPELLDEEYYDESDLDEGAEENQDQEIVRARFSMTDAVDKFDSYMVDSSSADFSGSLATVLTKNRVKGRMRKGAPMYKSFAKRPLPDREEYSMLPRGMATHYEDGEQETCSQKLQRLLFEVQELEEEIKAKSTNDNAQSTESADTNQAGIKKETLSFSEMSAQVASLQADLTRLGKNVVHVQEASYREAEVGKALVSKLNAYKDQVVLNASAETSSSKPEQPSSTNLNGSLTYELYYSPEVAKLAFLSKLGDMESRIALLEKVVGTHILQSADSSEDAVANILQSSGSLCAAIQKLDHYLSLLTQPRQLEWVSRRLQVLMSDLEKLSELRKKQQIDSSIGGIMMRSSIASNAPVPLPDGDATQAEHQRRVEFLFSMLEKLDNVSTLLPHLVSRLQALKSIHNEAALFSDNLKTLSDDQARLEDTSKSLESMMKSLVQSIKENQTIMTQNVASLESRIETVIKKIGQ